MTKGYDFYFKDGSDVLTFPITPGELSIKVGSNNKVISLISEGDVNILKSPSLTEVEFDARFPMRNFPYSREVSSFQTYFDKFKELKENKKAFRFIVARTTPKGDRTWDTNLLVSLEELEIQENADEGDDVIISFSLKQYKEYGVRKLPTRPSGSTSTESSGSTSTTPVIPDGASGTRVPENPPTPTNNPGKKYTIKSGDTLWGIAKKYYGDGSKWTKIYETNKTELEAEAKRRGLSSSSNGWWIFPGVTIILPVL